MKVTVPLADATATEMLGVVIAEAIRGQPGGVIFLQGDLGVGKTTLARALLRQLGVTGTIRSPTYTLMELYRAGDQAFLHMDLYRLADPQELHNLGLDDYPPAQHWWLVEWPERGAGVLSQADLKIELCIAKSGREAHLEVPELSASTPLIGALEKSLAAKYEYKTSEVR